MSKVPHTNNTDKIQHVGNVTLFPGDTREVDETLLSDYKKAEPEKAPEGNPVLKLLELSVPNVVEEIIKRTDTGEFVISNEDLDALEVAEQASNRPRQGVLNGIAEERLARANETQEAAEFLQELADMPDQDLDASLELYKDDEGKLALVQGEIDKRKAPPPAA